MFQQTRSRAYLSSLAMAPAIGVLLGEHSQGLCSIDFDDDQALEEFLAANPSLRGSLRTRGKRGANVWVIVDGDAPGTHHLAANGKHIGEWRAKGAHTIIAGRHPDGLDYSRIVDAPPVRLTFSALVWPWEDFNSGYRDTEGYRDTDSTDLTEHSDSTDYSDFTEEGGKKEGGEAATLGDKIRASERAHARIKEDVRVLKLYRTYIEKRFTPVQGKRNTDLIQMVTFLYRAVGEETLLALVTYYYDLNQSIFTDSREQHLSEASAHLKACSNSWFEELSAEQQGFVKDLPRRYTEAFRIFRDLSLIENERSPSGDFFISYNELSMRIGITQKEAQKILQTFESQGWLEVIQKGTKHQPRLKGKATQYRWMLARVIAILILSIPALFYCIPSKPTWPLLLATWKNREAVQSDTT